MKVREILDKELDKIKPSEKEIKELREKADNFCSKIGSHKKGVEVFIGGSLAKDTILDKGEQDIDIFVRFPKNMGEARIAEDIKGMVDGHKVKGSRDYFQIREGDVIFEVVPVTKIKKPEEARNVTDLSFFHVDYVREKIDENPVLADEIRLAKHFCYCHKCYGAESYIQGFSGYALELLIIHYGSFLKFIKAMSKNKGEKIVLDPEKYYPHKKDILTDLNEAKLHSPIIFIDPTYKRRNALAALSEETFEKFKKAARDFLNNPSPNFFKRKKINKEDYDLVLNVKTNKQEGDIAGSKLKKFFRVLKSELREYFRVKDEEFQYNEGQESNFYFNLKRKQRILEGPPKKAKNNASRFKKEHKNVYEKDGKLYAKEEPISPPKFVKSFKSKFKDKLESMDITGIDMVD